MRTLLGTLLVTALCLFDPAVALADEAATVVGTYRLISWEQRNADTGEARHLFGKDADGRLTYDAYGNLSIQLQRPGRPKFAANDFV